MIYVHSLGRASRYYSARTALAPGDARLSFSELEKRVQGIAAALSAHGFSAGDRLALLLPNSPEYIELVYACSWLGVIAVPINTRLSLAEIDRVLADAAPHGLVRHSSLPSPTVRISWQRVLDQDPLEIRNDLPPDVVYDPEAIVALIYTSGTTGRPKGVMVTHANILADIHHFNYWMRYTEGAVYLHAAPLFHIADFPAMFAAPAFGASQVTIPKFSPQTFCETVERERVSHTVLVPTMINLLTQFPDAREVRLEQSGCSGVRRVSNGARTHRAYEGTSAVVETGSGLWTQRDWLSDGSTGPGAHARPAVVLRPPLSWHRSAGHRRIRRSKSKLESQVNWSLGARTSCGGIGIIRRRLRLHFEMAGFAPATLAIRIPRDISTFWTA